VYYLLIEILYNMCYFKYHVNIRSLRSKQKYTADKTYRKNEIFTICNARSVSLCESNIHYVSKNAANFGKL